MLKKILPAICVLALAGCALNPMTPEEFRKGTVMMKPKETFVVDRPFPVIAANLRKRAPECLDVDHHVERRRTLIGTGGQSHLAGGSRSTVLVNGDRAELHVQVDYKGDLARRPEGGNYYFIADVQAVGPGKTRVDIYRTAIRSDVIHEAVKGWIHGSTQGCPDPRSFLG